MIPKKKTSPRTTSLPFPPAATRRPTATYTFAGGGLLPADAAAPMRDKNGVPIPPRSGVRLRAPTEAELEASHVSTLPAPVLDGDGLLVKWCRTVDPAPMVAAHMLQGDEKRVLESLDTARNGADIARRLGSSLVDVENALAFLFARGLVRCG